MSIIAFIIIGALAGILAGLLGIGGGLVTIPGLVLTFTLIGMPSEEIMHMAVGTSLASMIFCALSSSFNHLRRKNVEIRIAKKLFPGAIIGAIIGALVAKMLPSHFLKIYFGIFVILIALRIFFTKPKDITGEVRLPHTSILMAIGLGVSFLSISLGIGGGIFVVPTLTAFHVRLKKAIGTASVMSFANILIGAIAFFIFSVGTSFTYSDSMGFIYFPAFITIAIVSFCCAPLGVKLTHYLPTKWIKKIFAVVLFAAGMTMIFAT